MATGDLITSTRALQSLPGVSSNQTLTDLITAVSKAVKRYCGRDFTSTSYDELYNGTPGPRLPLHKFPIVAVARVACNPVVVLRIQNTSSANSRATVAVTATGLTLVRTASASTTTSTLAFGTFTTLATLAAAVTALGNGWSATVAAGYETWASADLRAVQGAVSAMNVQAALYLHTSELSDYDVDDQRGWLLRSRVSGAFECMQPGWFGGLNHWRIIYTAGYSTIPEDVQEATAQWVAAFYGQAQRDPGVSQQQIPATLSQSFALATRGMPVSVRELLVPYRIFPVGIVGG